jgi:hypothetical protein
MGAIKNYYFILGVSRNAGAAEINAAYESKLDAASRDESQAAMIGELTEAYECLSDPTRRSEYDTSFGRDPYLRPEVNVNQMTSAETAYQVEYEFQKLRNREKFKKRIIKTLCVAVMFVAFAGVAIRYGSDYFRSKAIIPQIPTAVLFTVPKSGTSAQVKPAEVIKGVSTKKPTVQTYNIRSGGVVTMDRSSCRGIPSETAPAKAVMRKDTAVFATKEMRDSTGALWFYVTNSQFEGWVNGRDVHIYKF